MSYSPIDLILRANVLIGLSTYLFPCALPHLLTSSPCLFVSCQSFIASHNTSRRFYFLTTPPMSSLAEPKRRQCRTAVLRKSLKSLIPNKKCSVPLMDIFCNRGSKDLDVSKRLKNLKIRVQQIRDFLLKLFPVACLIDPSSDTSASNLAEAGHIFVSVTQCECEDDCRF